MCLLIADIISNGIFKCVLAFSTHAHKHEAHYYTWIVISLNRDKVELINWSHPLGSNDVFVFLNLSKSQGCGSFHIALAIIYLQRVFKPIYNVLFAPQQKLLIRDAALVAVIAIIAQQAFLIMLIKLIMLIILIKLLTLEKWNRWWACDSIGKLFPGCSKPEAVTT